MSNLKKSLSFFVNVFPNGTDDQIVISFLTDPISLVPAGVGSGGFLSSLFSSTPSGVDINSLSCSLGIDTDHSSYSNITKSLTVKFTSTGTEDVPVLLYGVAIY